MTTCSSAGEVPPLQSLAGFVPGAIVPVQLSLVLCPALAGTVTARPAGVDAGRR